VDWIDQAQDRDRYQAVVKDARMLGLRSWCAIAMNREEWRKLLKEAKTLYEL
jgi:hypothetical protein